MAAFQEERAVDRHDLVIDAQACWKCLADSHVRALVAGLSKYRQRASWAAHLFPMPGRGPRHAVERLRQLFGCRPRL